MKQNYSTPTFVFVKTDAESSFLSNSGTPGTPITGMSIDNMNSSNGNW